MGSSTSLLNRSISGGASEPKQKPSIARVSSPQKFGSVRVSSQPTLCPLMSLKSRYCPGAVPIKSSLKGRATSGPETILITDVDLELELSQRPSGSRIAYGDLGTIQTHSGTGAGTTSPRDVSLSYSSRLNLLLGPSSGRGQPGRISTGGGSLRSASGISSLPSSGTQPRGVSNNSCEKKGKAADAGEGEDGGYGCKGNATATVGTSLEEVEEDLLGLELDNGSGAFSDASGRCDSSGSCHNLSSTGEIQLDTSGSSCGRLGQAVSCEPVVFAPCPVSCQPAGPPSSPDSWMLIGFSVGSGRHYSYLAAASGFQDASQLPPSPAGWSKDLDDGSSFSRRTTA